MDQVAKSEQVTKTPLEQTNISNRIYIVDGSGYIFRAFYAVPPLTAPSGLPTNALFGFSRMLLKLLGVAGRDPVIVVFDAGRATFRTDLYPEYKMNRGECPNELVPQLPFFVEVVAALGLPALKANGYEADDVIGTLVENYCKADEHEVVVVTADKDLAQLVAPHVKLWDTMRDQWLDEDGVRQKFGVSPPLIPELLALTGDSSDNIPGVPGVGPKTALALLQRFASVADILGRTNELRTSKDIRGREKFADFIEANPEVLKLSRKLVEINRQVPSDKIVVALPDNGAIFLDQYGVYDLLKRQLPIWDAVRALSARLGFSDFERDVTQVTNSLEGTLKFASTESPPLSCITVLADKFAEFGTCLSSVKSFAFDLETSSLEVASAKIVGVAIAWEDSTGYYIPISHEDKSGTLISGQVSWDEFLAVFAPILRDNARTIFGQNLKFDIAVCASNSLIIEANLFDTMIAAYLLRPDARRYSLDVLVRDYLGDNFELGDFKAITDDDNNFSKVSIDSATTYAAMDALATWRLASLFLTQLDKEGLAKVFYEIEMPIVPILSDLERRGMLIDRSYLANLSCEFAEKLTAMQEQIFAAAGHSFNINSPKQLSQVLFDELKIATKGLKRTKGGVISTDSSVLERLAQLHPSHPLPKAIIEYRTLQKLKSTYVDPLPQQVSALTGRLHTRLHQTTTGTGRLSSSEPNLQNIPIQSYEGQRIRRAFIAPSGKVLISADYSQIELRVLAHLSGDALLRDAFLNDRDIHEQTAREILNKSEADTISPQERRLGKVINFGVVYGMSPFRLGRELDIPVSDASFYIDAFFQKYSGVKRFFDEVVKNAEETGEVTTMFGRRRLLSDVDASDRDKGFLNRVAMNAPVQGSAADIIKLAMIRVNDVLKPFLPDVQMILQIHDELLFESETCKVEVVLPVIISTMEKAVELSVPLKVEVAVGSNWMDVQ